jgi:RNA polymerase sigma-70 factor (ECF subfamily)
MGPLSRQFIDTLRPLSESLADAAARVSELESVLEERLRAARAIWPRVSVADDVLAPLVGRWIGHAGSLERLRTDDGKLAELLLAAGCEQGDEAALRSFETRYLHGLDAVFNKMRLAPSMADEARQLVRVKLLVTEPGVQPRLARYAAGGDLDGLVRVVATRTAISLLRKQSAEQRSGDDEDLVQLVSPLTSPELRSLRAEHRELVRGAFQAAIVALASRERNVLRLHLLDHLNIDEIGLLYRVHRGTAARWIQKARDAIHAGARRQLEASGIIQRTELDSLLRAGSSQLDLSLERLLRPVAEEK